MSGPRALVLWLRSSPISSPWLHSWLWRWPSPPVGQTSETRPRNRQHRGVFCWLGILDDLNNMVETCRNQMKPRQSKVLKTRTPVFFENRSAFCFKECLASSRSSSKLWLGALETRVFWEEAGWKKAKGSRDQSILIGWFDMICACWYAWNFLNFHIANWFLFSFRGIFGSATSAALFRSRLSFSLLKTIFQATKTKQLRLKPLVVPSPAIAGCTSLANLESSMSIHQFVNKRSHRRQTLLTK